MATFDNQADDVLRPLFAAYRADTMRAVRPAGALAARRGHRRWRSSRLIAAASAGAALVLLVVGGGYVTFHRSSPPLSVTSSPTPQGVPPVPPDGPSPSGPSADRPPSGPTTGGAVPGQHPGTPASPAGTPRCHSSGLAVSRGGSDGAMGQIYTDIVLRNTSGRACYLSGAPRIQAVDAAGRLLPTTVGSVGPAAHRVVLRPDASGYAVFRTAQPDLVNNATAPCTPAATALLVTPPAETISLRLAGPWAVCDAAIGAITATPQAPAG